METSNAALIPTDAYLYFPEDKDKFAGEGKKLIRFIFEGETTFQKFENDSLDQLYTEFEKQKVQLPENWRRSDSLKFLIACSFDFNKSIKGISEYIEWRKAILPIQLTTTIEEYLRSGIIYMHGRDHRFKPIIVLKCYKVDPKTLDIDQFLLTLGYFLEYLIANTLLPGQVERWVFIQDLKGMGISSIPFTALKRILGFLQNNFRSRLSKMYIMNSPSTLYFSWKMVKPLLEETTTAKINFSKDSLNEDMWKHINKSQVEAKFGGTAPDTENGYWPPVVVSNNYFVEGDKPQDILVSKETYKKMHSEGKLAKYTVSQQLVNEE